MIIDIVHKIWTILWLHILIFVFTSMLVRTIACCKIWVVNVIMILLLVAAVMMLMTIQEYFDIIVSIGISTFIVAIASGLASSVEHKPDHFILNQVLLYIFTFTIFLLMLTFVVRGNWLKWK